MVRSISIYQPKNGIERERKFNQCHIISKERKNKIFAKQQKSAAPHETRKGEEQEVVILSYNIEQRWRKNKRQK
jgi:hypothetical protein